MSTTVLDIINGAGRLIGIKSEEQPLTGEQTANALELLNQLIEEWNIDGTMVYTMNRNTYTLVPGTQDYTMGPSGTLAAVRPDEIAMMSVLPVTTSLYPYEIPMRKLGDVEWRETVVKTTPSTFPLAFWDDGNFPLRGLHLWPVPASAAGIVIYSWNKLSAFSSVSETVSLPAGYARALRYGLALEMAPEYDRMDKIALLSGAALASKAKIRERNFEIEFMTPDGNIMDAPAIQSRGFVVD